MMGSGLIVLGTHFLWCLVCQRQSNLLCLLPSLLPVLVVVVLMLCEQQVEMAVAVILGTCMANLVVMGIILMCSRIKVTHSDIFPLFCVLLGALPILIAGGEIHVYGGLSLLFVGLVSSWQALRPTKGNLIKHKQCSRWYWLIGLGLIIIVMIGAWLVVKQFATMSVLLNMSSVAFLVMILAPMLGTWTGLHVQKQWQCGRVWHACLWTNVILLTLGLGLMSVLNGGIHFPQSLVLVAVPNLIMMTFIIMAGVLMPQKTTRWWGGLVVVVDCVFMFSWLV